MGGAQRRGDSDQGLSIPPLSLVATSSTVASDWPMIGESDGVYKTRAARPRLTLHISTSYALPGRHLSGCYGPGTRDGRRRDVTIQTQVSITFSGGGIIIDFKIYVSHYLKGDLCQSWQNTSMLFIPRSHARRLACLKAEICSVILTTLIGSCDVCRVKIYGYRLCLIHLFYFFICFWPSWCQRAFHWFKVCLPVMKKSRYFLLVKLIAQLLNFQEFCKWQMIWYIRIC